MPPFVPRKRSHTPEDLSSRPAKKQAVLTKASITRGKPTLFDAVDNRDTKVANAERSRQLLAKLGGTDDDSSEAESDEFEDIPATKHAEEPDDEEMDWEDAIPENGEHDSTEREIEIGDVSVALKEDGSYVQPLVSTATGKKGPSKRERRARELTHTMHVQALLWHNTVRNSWLNDAELHRILLSQLSSGMKDQIAQWKRSMGMLSKEELEQLKAQSLAKKTKNNKKARPKKDLKGRDWSYSADFTEIGNIDMSHGDPLLKLLKLMSAYWQKRFTITAPGIRKRGYMPLRKLHEHVKSWEKDPNQEQHGERIANLKVFRRLAQSCEGSRDVGAQLFVALLRAIGLNVRMVANLQPAGFGWSKGEEAIVKNTSDANEKNTPHPTKPKQLPVPKLREILTPKQGKKTAQAQKPSRKSTRGDQSRPINIDDSDSALSEPPSDIEALSQSEDLSVLDITPLSKKRPTKKYDRDLPYPVYWAEVLSPATKKFIPVDPIVLSTIGSSDELLSTFEPRGSKADKGKQVICYAVGFSSDGTAKDVTIRYLKRHQLPGKTKGVRMPVEKVPIYNRKGKVRHYEEHDWFAELMLRFRKRDSDRTDADKLEEGTDLQPWKPAKEEKVLDKESLAWYKASAEFVLEEHLRREEALLPGAEPVKTFTAGKNDKAKDHLVFKRADVVSCKTVESWHKEGRGLLPGEQPLKFVPIRAVTLQRKREIEEAERETGEKLKQGLYSEAQTDWIIPDPIVNGVIPKNAFGNMDVYVPTMVPAGAVHLPMKGTAKICRRLEIDYAEACTGFEFGNKRAVPVITGVVVAKNNATLVRDAWKVERAEQQRKEDVKRTAAALHWWRKMLMGMRIIDRMKAEYAHTSTTEDEYNPFVRKAVAVKASQPIEPKSKHNDTEGGFLLDEDDAADHHELGGGFIVEGAEGHETTKSALGDASPSVPISLQDLHEKQPRGRTTKPVKGKKAAAPKKSLLKLEDSETSELSDLNEERDAVAPRVKISPTKSPYFSSQDVEEETETEIVTPRRTTARTRRQ